MISYASRSNVAQTSLDAFNAFVADGKLSPSQNIVYDELCRMQPATNLELARSLLWEVNLVTPRINELRKLGVVVQDCVRPCCISGHKAIAWKVNKNE